MLSQDSETKVPIERRLAGAEPQRDAAIELAKQLGRLLGGALLAGTVTADAEVDFATKTADARKQTSR